MRFKDTQARFLPCFRFMVLPVGVLVELCFIRIDLLSFIHVSSYCKLCLYCESYRIVCGNIQSFPSPYGPSPYCALCGRLSLHKALPSPAWALFCGLSILCILGSPSSSDTSTTSMFLLSDTELDEDGDVSNDLRASSTAQFIQDDVTKIKFSGEWILRSFVTKLIDVLCVSNVR